ncbi:uncharacterized protein LOC135625040 isoform X2 [Musa acuminata AAA Group]|uniref:uncharacterized protein LOC135625040 isoform X2 n=1 Tax=Musa acuminata AAA Group TaxID=214697 RepID=UPI0031CFFA2A
MEREEERGGLLQSYSASNISFPAPLCSSLPCCSSTSPSLLLPKAIVTNSSLTLAAPLAALSAPKTSPTFFGSSSSAAGIRYLHTGHDLLARLHNPHGTPAAASPGGCNSDSSAGSPWKMTIPRVSGLSMTTRSSSGVSPSAGPVRTTPKTMGKRAVPRRSSPSLAPPSLRRIPSSRPSSRSAAAAAIDRDRRVDGVAEVCGSIQNISCSS